MLESHEHICKWICFYIETLIVHFCLCTSGVFMRWFVIESFTVCLLIFVMHFCKESVIVLYIYYLKGPKVCAGRP